MKIPFKKSWWPYLLFALAYLVLSLTGTRAEVFGFLQRGLLATGLMRAQTAEAPAADPEYLREEAYELVLADTGGQLHRLSEFRGKVVLVNLWATWCPPCVYELPALDRLQQRFGDKNFVVVAVSVDQNPELARKMFSDRLALSHLQFYFEPPERLARTFPMDVLPSNFILDREGRAIGMLRSYVDWDGPAADEFVERLLAGTLPPLN